VNQERKVSVLRNLLERVQKRAASPRVAPAPTAVAATPLAPAPAPAVSTPAPQPPKTPARPGSATLPLDFGSDSEAASFRPPSAAAVEPPRAEPTSPAGAVSDRDASSQLESEAEQGPPSAPRLREVPDEELSAEEREIDEEEPPIETPPPESGRQDVTPSPSLTVSESEEDISITVTMEESEAPPPISPSLPDVAPMPMSAGHGADIHEVSGPQPRLALVSEPEIELHGMTPLSAIAEPVLPVAPAKPPPPPEPGARSLPGSSFRPQDIELAVPVAASAPSVLPATPSGVRPVPPPSAPFARTAPSVPDAKPPVSAAQTAPAQASPVPPGPDAGAPPIRLMAQPLADTAATPSPPVEIWASTLTPAELRGQVASFVGQNAKFEPRTFGELVRASIALGEEKP